MQWTEITVGSVLARLMTQWYTARAIRLHHAVDAMEASYAAGVTDEFVVPTVIR